MRSSILSAAILLFTAVSLPEARSSAKISSESLLRPPRVYGIHMSPDGKYAAALAPVTETDQTGLIIIDLDTCKIKRSFKWESGYNIYRFRWMNNEDIAFNVGRWNSYVAGIYSVNVNRKSINTLVGSDAVVSIVDPIHDSPNAWIWIKDGFEMKPSLAMLDETGNAGSPDAMGANRVPGTKDNPLISNRIMQPKGQVFGWRTDWDNEPRIVTRFWEDKLEYLHRNQGDDDWTSLPLDPDEWDIEAFSADNAQLYVSGYDGHETTGLYLYDIAKNTFSDVLFRDEYYDFSSTARYIAYQDNIVGIRYTRDVPTVVWLVEQMNAIQRVVDAALPGKANLIYHLTDDLSRILINSTSDRSPSRYYILDLKEKALRLVSPTRPWLKDSGLAKTEVFHFKTEDGLKLEGYLTRPQTGEAPYPTVCLVHGGPWARDYGTFNDETQFFANRGYAVLRVNYRGSEGYGKRISEDEAYKFRKMHDDITQAVRLSVEQGIADPERLAIMGASFGGYAALCGAAFEPDLYKCAITVMGVFDWEQMIKDRKWQRHKYSHHKLLEELGDPKANEAHFQEISPIYHTDKIRIPIFIIHGKSDKNVSVKHSKKLAADLKSKGAEHKTMFLKGEGHNIFEMKTRVKVYDQIVEFLEKNMK